MPIYEYECQACGHTFDRLQKVSDPALKICPKCNKSSLNKLISAAGFQLKGTGWYETDFKHSGKKKPESKTDTKTETKVETEAKKDSKEVEKKKDKIDSSSKE